MTESRTGKLRSRILNASGWTAAGLGISQLLRIGGNLVMTRLLMPEAFGVMAIAWMVVSGLAMLSDAGIRQCIVQSKNGDAPAFLNTAWAIQVVRGAVLTVAGIAVAGLSAIAQSAGWVAPGSAYAHADLPLVIAAVSFSALFAGFESTKIATASRDLTLSRVVAIDLTGQIVGLAVMVSWAWVSPTIWALIAGVVIVGPLRTMLTHFALPGARNRWTWDAIAVREIRSFGNWIMFSSTLGFLVNSGDRMVLAALMDANILGQYSVALTIVGSIQLVILAIIGNVAFPALSEAHRTRPERLKEDFYRLRMPIDVIALALLGLLFTTGPQIAHLLYDDRYALTGPLIQILAVSLFATRYDVATQCYLALGKSKLLPAIVAVRILPLFLVTPVAFHYWGGALAATWVVALVPLSSIPVHLFLMQRNRILNWRREILVLPSIALGLFAGTLFVYLLDRVS